MWRNTLSAMLVGLATCAEAGMAQTAPDQPELTRKDALFAEAREVSRLGDLLRGVTNAAEAGASADMVAAAARERRREGRPYHSMLLRGAAATLVAYGDRERAVQLLEEVRLTPETEYDGLSATIEPATILRGHDAARAEALYREVLNRPADDVRRLEVLEGRAARGLASLLVEKSRFEEALAVRRQLLDRLPHSETRAREALLRAIAHDLDALGRKDEAAAARAEAIALLRSVEGTTWLVVSGMMERALARADGNEEAYARELQAIYNDPAVRLSDWAVIVGWELSVSLSKTRRHAEAKALREELAMMILAREAELDAAAAAQMIGTLSRAIRSVLLAVGSSITPSQPELEPLYRAAGDAFLRRYAGDSSEDALARQSVISAADTRARRATRREP